LAGVVVVPDRGGQGEDPLQDKHEYACGGFATMALKVELTLVGIKDRLDGLA